MGEETKHAPKDDAQESLKRKIHGLEAQHELRAELEVFKEAAALNDQPAADSHPVIGFKFPEGHPQAGMVYAGRSPTTGEHLVVEAEDVKGPDGQRLRLTFNDAVQHAAAKGMVVPTLEKLDALQKNKTEIGGFDPEGWYWSSSEYTNLSARVERFSDGRQTVNLKTNGTYVRCARRCLVI